MISRCLINPPLPHMIAESVVSLKPLWEHFAKEGVTTVLFDKDGCLTYHTSIPDPSREWMPDSILKSVQECQKHIPNVALVSNSMGRHDHPHSQHIPEFEKHLNIKVLTHKYQKPDKRLGVELFHSNKIDPETTVFVGDRLWTDVMFARDHSMYSILTLPLVSYEYPEDIPTKYLRKIEHNLHLTESLKKMSDNKFSYVIVSDHPISKSIPESGSQSGIP